MKQVCKLFANFSSFFLRKDHHRLWSKIDVFVINLICCNLTRQICVKLAGMGLKDCKAFSDSFCFFLFIVEFLITENFIDKSRDGERCIKTNGQLLWTTEDEEKIEANVHIVFSNEDKIHHIWSIINANELKAESIYANGQCAESLHLIDDKRRIYRFRWTNQIMTYLNWLLMNMAMTVICEKGTKIKENGCFFSVAWWIDWREKKDNRKKLIISMMMTTAASSWILPFFVDFNYFSGFFLCLTLMREIQWHRTVFQY